MAAKTRMTPPTMPPAIAAVFGLCEGVEVACAGGDGVVVDDGGTDDVGSRTRSGL
jgi:hypothetical protein